MILIKTVLPRTAAQRSQTASHAFDRVHTSQEKKEKQ